MAYHTYSSGKSCHDLRSCENKETNYEDEYYTSVGKNTWYDINIEVINGYWGTQPSTHTCKSHSHCNDTDPWISVKKQK